MLFDIINEVILGIYTTEILMKWYSGFLVFWRCLWNIFDVIIVLIMFNSRGMYDVIINIGLLTKKIMHLPNQRWLFD